MLLPNWTPTRRRATRKKRLKRYFIISRPFSYFKAKTNLKFFFKMKVWFNFHHRDLADMKSVAIVECIDLCFVGWFGPVEGAPCAED